MKIPEKVMKVLGDESSVKVLSTISNDGKLHSIAAGSIMAMGEDRLFVAEIMMNTTSKNIQANKNVATKLNQQASAKFAAEKLAKQRIIWKAKWNAEQLAKKQVLAKTK